MKPGDKYIKKKTVGGKVLIAFVVSLEPENEYIIQMKTEDGEKFFIRSERLERHWHNASEGIQLKIFK